VRLADDGDVERLADLHLHSALTAYAHIFPPQAPKPTRTDLLAGWKAAVAAASTPAGPRVLVAQCGDEVVGVVMTARDKGAPDVGHLSRFYVTPLKWGRGIGTRLYQAAVDDLRRRGFGEATLWVLEMNTRARSWYERLGWKATEERRTVFEPPPIVDVLYRLPDVVLRKPKTG